MCVYYTQLIPYAMCIIVWCIHYRVHKVPQVYKEQWLVVVSSILKF